MKKIVYLKREDGLMFTENGCPIENNLQTLVLEIGNYLPKPLVVGKPKLWCVVCEKYTKHAILQHIPSKLITIVCTECGNTWEAQKLPHIVP